jgi:hypothetical protein
VIEKQIGGSPKRKAAIFFALLISTGGVIAALHFVTVCGPRFPHPPSTKCINNLRQIDGAKQQWALEKQKGTNDVPSATDISP